MTGDFNIRNNNLMSCFSISSKWGQMGCMNQDLSFYSILFSYFELRVSMMSQPASFLLPPSCVVSAHRK